MERSESISQLAKALAAAQGELRNAPLDKANSHFGQRYASLASITDTIRPVLSKHGIAVIQLSSTPEQGKVGVSTIMLHSSGEYIRETMVVPAAGNIQQVGGTITYMRRYALAAMLGIVGDEDDDGEGVVAPTRPAKASKPAKAPQPSAPSEGPSASPAGFERLYPREVEQKTGKETGKTFYAIRFDTPAGNSVKALTFSSTIAERLQASIGVATDVSLKESTRNGSVYFTVDAVI